MILDSNAVIGFLDRGDALHDSAASAMRKLIPRQRLFVSVVTYAEVLTGAKLGHQDEGHIRGFFSDLISAVLPVDLSTGDKAAEIRARSKNLRMPDALILATAETDPEVDLLLSGDTRATRVPGLRCRVELLET